MIDAISSAAEDDTASKRPLTLHYHHELTSLGCVCVHEYENSRL